jgi:hypothetical protein
MMQTINFFNMIDAPFPFEWFFVAVQKMVSPERTDILLKILVVASFPQIL